MNVLNNVTSYKHLMTYKDRSSCFCLLSGIILCRILSDRSKAEMDLKELSETVQQKQGAAPVLTSPKRQIKSRFQLNLDKTIESCKAQLGQ